MKHQHTKKRAKMDFMDYCVIAFGLIVAWLSFWVIWLPLIKRLLAIRYFIYL